MRHDVRQVARVLLVALHTAALVFLVFHDWLLAGLACVVLATVTAALSRREPEPALDPGEPLTMLGPVWIEHPEADFASPPRRFT